MAAAKLATLKWGRPKQESQKGSADPFSQVSIERAAKMMDVSEKTVKRARAVREQGVPELVEAVERGEVSVSAAARRECPPKWTNGK